MSRIMRLSDLGRIVTGNTPKTSDFRNYNSKDICFVKPSDIPVDCIGRLRESEFYISEFARDKARMLPKGSVLLTCIGIIGKVAVNEIECAFNQQINAIIPDCDKCDCIYLAYALSAKKDYLQALANAPVVPIINKTQFSAFQIPVPSLSVQSNIVKRIEIIDYLISLRQRQAEKLDELVKARFVEMFGDPVRNTKHWEKSSLLALGSCKNGMSFHANESGIKLRCLGVGDFKNLSYIDDVEQLPFVSLAEKPSANCFLHDGDIVFVRSNGNKALVGRCLLVYPRDTPTIYSGFCIRYRLVTEKVDPIYALHVLKADGIRQKMSGRGANIQNLNQKILAAIEMPIPPLPLQNAFATFVYEVDREKERIQRSAALLETLKRSLMQQYFG